MASTRLEARIALRSLDLSMPNIALRIVKVFQWRQIQERRYGQRQPAIGCMQAGVESFRSFVSTAIAGETPLAAMAEALAKSGRLPTEGYPT